MHFVGQLAAPPTGTPVPSWWADAVADDRRTVHVTQGTYDVDPRDLILPALEELAASDVTVLAATAGAALPDAAVPANAYQAPFLPYDRLLPRASVVVTNGGWGGVLASPAHGVPLVVAGATLDEPEIARLVAWSGAGVDLRTGTPSPARVRAAAERVLGDRAFTDRAAGIGRSLSALGGAEWQRSSPSACRRPARRYIETWPTRGGRSPTERAAAARQRRGCSPAAAVAMDGPRPSRSSRPRPGSGHPPGTR